MKTAQPGKLLEALIGNLMGKLGEINSAQSAEKPNPNKWSKREILGHLIDSAINNHPRFVIPPEQYKLEFATYPHEYWVNAHDYQSMDWMTLVQTFEIYNGHLAVLITQLSDNQLNRLYDKHNFDQIAFVHVPKDQPASLRYLIIDYMVHIEHHIKQIIPEYKLTISHQS
jgi:hypothetical protein